MNSTKIKIINQNKNIMKKSTLLLLALISLSTSVFSQTNRENETLLTFDLSTLLYPDNPRYKLGVIQSISPKFRIGADLAFGSDAITANFVKQDSEKDWSIYEVRAELYFIMNPTRKVKHYFSGEGFFSYLEQAGQNGFYKPEARMGEFQYDSAGYTRTKYGFNIKYGVIIPFGNLIGINTSVGPGFRVRNNTYNNVVNLRPDEGPSHGRWFPPYEYNEGTRVGINIAAGVKVFYKL